MKKLFTALAALLTALALTLPLAACGGNKKTDVTSVTLNKSELTLTVGEEQALTATVLPDNATDKTVVWASSDEAVATVTDGTVKGIKDGTATISASADGKSASCKITVTTPAPVELTKEQWNKAFDNTIYAENLTLSLYSVDNTYYIDAASKTISCNSSSKETITITNEGENFSYNGFSGYLDMCESYAGKKITSFKELSSTLICITTHIDLIKEMNFTYNSEDNSYFVQIQEGVNCSVYFEGTNDNARISKLVMNTNSEWHFISYGTTIIPTA